MVMTKEGQPTVSVQHVRQESTLMKALANGTTIRAKNVRRVVTLCQGLRRQMSAFVSHALLENSP
jgi:hypothetical protein